MMMIHIKLLAVLMYDKFLSYGKKTNKQYFVSKHSSESISKSADNGLNAANVVKKLTSNANGNTKTFVSTSKSAVQPSKRLCFVCKSDKHLIADCPEKQDSAKSTAQGNSCIATTNTPVVTDCNAVDKPNLLVDCNVTNCERQTV